MTSTTTRLIFLRLNLSLLLLIIGFHSGCSTGTRNVTQESPYLPLTGQRYRTRVDLYLFLNPHGTHPYLGINDPKAHRGAKVLPVTVTRQHVGRTFSGVTIIDIVPAGAELVSQSVLRDSSSQGVIVFLICSLSYGEKRVEKVDTYFIQSNVNGRDDRLPEIDPSLAERLK